MSSNTSLTALERIAAALAFGKNIGVKFTVFSLSNPCSANTISLDRAAAIAAIEGALMHLKATPGHDGPRVRKSNEPSTHQRGQFKAPADVLALTEGQVDVHRTVDRHPAELTVQAVDQRLYSRRLVEQRPFNRTNADRFNRHHSQKYSKGKWVTTVKAKYLASTKAKVVVCAPIREAAALSRWPHVGRPAVSVLATMPTSAMHEVPRFKSTQGGTAPSAESPSMAILTPSPPTSVCSPSTSATAFLSSGTTHVTSACLLALPRAVDAIDAIGTPSSPNTIEATPSISSQSSDHAAAETCAATTASAAVATSSARVAFLTPSPPSSISFPSTSATALPSSGITVFTAECSLALPRAVDPIGEFCAPSSPNTIEATPFTFSRSSDYAAAGTCVAETASATVDMSSPPSSCPSPSASATPLLSSATSAFTSSSSLVLPLANNPVRELSESDHEDLALLYESVQCLLGTVAPAAEGPSLAQAPSKSDGLRHKSRKVVKRVRSFGTALKRKLSKTF